MNDNIQSAEEFLDKLRSCDYMEGDWDCERDEAVQMLESRDEAQRQAGRQEAQEELENIKHLAEMRGNGWSKATKELLELSKRYAALEEAARDAVRSRDCFCQDQGHCTICRLGKALADLEQARKG